MFYVRAFLLPRFHTSWLRFVKVASLSDQIDVFTQCSNNLRILSAQQPVVSW